MIDFLLALLIICGILAIPPLRRVAVWLIGGIVILFVAVLAMTPAYHAAPNPLAPSQTAAMRQQQAAVAAEALSKHLIAPDEVEIREFRLTTFGRPLELIQPLLDDVGISAVVHNLSPHYTLKELELKAELFDCPAATSVPGPQCDQIGQVQDRLRAPVPPGQVREMTGQGLSSLRNIPPLRGHLVLGRSIVSIGGALPDPDDTRRPDGHASGDPLSPPTSQPARQAAQ